MAGDRGAQLVLERLTQFEGPGQVRPGGGGIAQNERTRAKLVQGKRLGGPVALLARGGEHPVEHGGPRAPPPCQQQRGLERSSQGYRLARSAGRDRPGDQLLQDAGLRDHRVGRGPLARGPANEVFDRSATPAGEILFSHAGSGQVAGQAVAWAVRDDEPPLQQIVEKAGGTGDLGQAGKVLEADRTGAEGGQGRDELPLRLGERCQRGGALGLHGAGELGDRTLLLARRRRALQDAQRMAADSGAKAGGSFTLGRRQGPPELALEQRQGVGRGQAAQGDRARVPPQPALARGEHEAARRCGVEQALDLLALELDVVEQHECPACPQQPAALGLGGLVRDLAAVGAERSGTPLRPVAVRRWGHAPRCGAERTCQCPRGHRAPPPGWRPERPSCWQEAPAD